MSELKVGDRVYVDISKSELNKIVKNNKDLVYEIIQSYTASDTKIIKIEKNEGYCSKDLFYLESDNGKIPWYRSELRSFKTDFMKDAIEELNITLEEANLVYDALVEEKFSSDDIKYLMEDEGLRVFKNKEEVFYWFFDEEPDFDNIMNSVGKIAITPIDIGMTIKDLIYEEFLNEQENYKKVNDDLYIAWYL